MTATHDDTVAELQRTIGELRRERDTLQAREATLGEVLAARDAALAQRNSEYAERIEQQLATNDVLKAMSATLSDTQPVFDLITVRARELCGSLASMLFEFDGERLHLRSWGGWDPAAAQDYLRQFPMRPDRGTAVGRTTLDRCAVHIRDIDQDPEIAQTVRIMGVRSTLGVPLLRDGQVIGVIAIGLATVGGFSDSQVALLETFAEQAVIAITSAETSRQLQERTATLATRNTEYRERITHQSATIDVLKAMSGSPGDAQPVFDLIAERARDICGGYGVSVHEFDGSVLHLRAYTGVSEDARVREAYEAQYPTSLTHEVPVARAIMERRVTRFDDFDADPGLSVVRATVRSAVAVPMMRGNASIGGLIMGSRERGGFSDSQIELLKTFAEQAVIAITSAETYRTLQTRTRDLQQSLEYQTATSDVLKVISRSAYDLKAVLQALLDTAARLCAADFGALMIRDGDVFRTSAIIPISPEHEAFVRRKVFVPSPHGSVVERTAFARQITHTEDIATLSDYVTSGRGFVVSGTALGVPLFLEGDVVGVFTLHRQRTERFTDAQIELVSTFADQAVIAIENTRLLTEQREALEQQTATAEVLQVINSSPGDLAPVFDALLEKATRLCEAPFGTLWNFDGDRFDVCAVHGEPRFRDWVRHRGPIRPDRDASPLGRILAGERVVSFDDWRDEGYRVSSRTREMTEASGIRSAIWVALLKDDVLLGTITVYRQEVRPFSDKQIELLENFAAQAVIAMENARLLTEQREALEQQTATAEVLQVINANPGNLTPVFDAMLEKAMRLCEAAFGELDTFDGERFKPAALLGIPAAYAKVRTSTPRTGMPGTVDSRFRAGANVLHIADLMAEDIYRSGNFDRRSLVDLGGARTALAVALRKDDVLLGNIMIYRQEVRQFSDRQVALLQGFAAQAVIAMENARLISEQQEALEQQTATAEVLQVINASPGNLAPVFDAMLEKAMRLCEAAFGYLLSYDGEQFQTVAHQGLPPRFAEYLPRMDQPGPTGAYARILGGAPLVHVTDLMDGDVYQTSPLRRALVDLGGARTSLIVAIRSEDRLLGIFTIYRREVRQFSDKQVALVESFAAQAAIAMENARLINEQREALEQQTATAEVLQVINANPGNLTPVFDAILEKAHSLIGAVIGALVLYEGPQFRAVATHGFSEQHNTLVRQPHGPTPGQLELLDGRRFKHYQDLSSIENEQHDEVTRSHVENNNARTALWVPLRKDDRLLGIISVYRLEVRPFLEKEVALLENFAAQAVIAMENARLLNEVRQRQEELRVTFENMGDGVAMFDKTQHLVAWNRKFQDILDVPDDIIARRQTFSEYVRYLAERGEYDPEADPEEHVRLLIEQAGQSRTYERTRPDGRVIEIRHNPVSGGGFVLIYADITERKQNEAEIRAARDAAEEASRTIEAAYRELKTAQANLIQAEKMASLGQLTAGIAHEIKNPLNFVNNFSALSAELIDELRDVLAPEPLGETARTEVDDLTALLKGNLEKVVQHGQRADGIVRSMLDHSRGSSGERRMVDLNALIDEALALAYHGARAQDQSFNITLERDFGEGIAPIEVNPQDITRVFLNIFANGFYATTKRTRDGGDTVFEPTLKITTRGADEAVEIRVRDNGSGIPTDIRDKLFQPFFTTKPTGEGTGLGLSITYDIVTQQHGGSIAVDSKVGEYSEFTIQLPRKP